MKSLPQLTDDEFKLLVECVQNAQIPMATAPLATNLIKKLSLTTTPEEVEPEVLEDNENE